MGSDSDMKVMSKAADMLEKLGIEYEMTIISAHREPDVFFEYAKSAEEKDFKVIIAGAGMAAHLPGMCAAIFPMPVIGVPMSGKNLAGEDALFSIVQMPPGIPVATVAIDGGMFDNPRYALYQSSYTCILANKAGEPADYTATIAGKCCESGDLIQEHTLIQKPEEGDILAVLSTGAYNYSMASNYNRNLKPAVVMVSRGKSRIVVKGETYEDLVRNDV